MTDTAREEGGPAGLSIYLRRPVIVVLLLGFSSGLPLALSGATLKVWLTEAGVTLGAVGLFGLVGLPYTLKFLWSPLIDRLPLPVLTRLLGRRRSWLMLSQICLMAALVALGLTNPAEDPWPTAVAALAVAFFSASQDIVIDAFRIESLSEHEQGAGAAVIQLGYRIAMLVSGGGALILADQIPWEMVYVAMAGLVLVGFLTALFSPEPSTPPVSLEGGPAQWIKDAVVGPFLDFAMRPGAFYILIFILLFPLGEAIAGAMSSPFYVDIGFSKTEIGVIAKGLGLGATIVGTLAGGLLVGRIGIARGLLVCGIAQTATTLMFVFLATVGPESWALAVTIAMENFTGGMGTAAFVAYLSSLCSTAFTATQYALLSSFMAVARTFLASFGGYIAQYMGWVPFFLIATVAALPGLFLLLWIMRRYPADAESKGGGKG